MGTFEKINDSKIENLVLSTKDILFCILCCKQTFIEFLCFIYTQGFTTSCKSLPVAVSVQSARKSQFWCVMIIFIKKRPVTSVPEVNTLLFSRRFLLKTYKAYSLSRYVRLRLKMSELYKALPLYTCESSVKWSLHFSSAFYMQGIHALWYLLIHY